MLDMSIPSPRPIPRYEKDQIITRSDSINSQETMLQPFETLNVNNYSYLIDIFKLILNLQDPNLILEPRPIHSSSVNPMIININIPGDIWLYHDPIKISNIKTNILTEFNQMLSFELINDHLQFDDITLKYYVKLLHAYKVYDTSSKYEEVNAPLIPTTTSTTTTNMDTCSLEYEPIIYRTSSNDSVSSLKLFGKKVINTKRISSILSSRKSYIKRKRTSSAPTSPHIRQGSISSTKTIIQAQPPALPVTPQGIQPPTPPHLCSPVASSKRKSPSSSTEDRLRNQQDTYQYYQTLVKLRDNCFEMINRINQMNRGEVGFNKFKKLLEFVEKNILKFIIIDIMNMTLSYCKLKAGNFRHI